MPLDGVHPRDTQSQIGRGPGALSRGIATTVQSIIKPVPRQPPVRIVPGAVWSGSDTGVTSASLALPEGGPWVVTATVSVRFEEPAWVRQPWLLLAALYAPSGARYLVEQEATAHFARASVAATYTGSGRALMVGAAGLDAGMPAPVEVTIEASVSRPR